MNDLEQLWSLAGDDFSSPSENYNEHFDAIGLYLLKDGTDDRYWCTPTNSITIACTCGDGVHFGIIPISGKEIDKCPIVGTFPSAFDSENMILGETLKEFLALGCRVGYNNLENISYADDSESIESGEYDSWAEDEDIELLKRIESHFGLATPKELKKRFTELKLKYYHLLEFSDEYYEIHPK